MKLNLNTSVRVKITPYGHKMYVEKYGSQPFIDPDGYHRTMLWVLMKIWGEFLDRGFGHMVMETDIELLDPPSFFTEYEIKDMEHNPHVLRSVAYCHDSKDAEGEAMGFDTSLHINRAKELRALADKIEAEY